MTEKKVHEKTMHEILRIVAPGSPLREGIDNVLRANTGGLIVVGYNEKVKSIVDGGFQINCRCTPSTLYELAKMDGAIILNEKADKIILANGQLAPDSAIPSTETGMRHRTAERVARETKSLVIAISQRRNVITLYQGDLRYALKDIAVILAKANLAIQTLEKYKAVLQQSISDLSFLEFEEIVTYADLLRVFHRYVMVLRIKGELLSYLNELGTEGRLIRLQMNELLSDSEAEGALLIKDYSFEKEGKPATAVQRLSELAQQEILEDSVLLKVLGYNGYIHLDESVNPRGYRMLNKIPRLPGLIVENLVNRFGNFTNVTNATVGELDDVEGIGEVRAKKIQEGLRMLRNQLVTERKI
ncbi:DNA integrity scanning protein DisA [Peribacillus cavernae]|uniref:DNA integrity scanning protein DisA n=1 Tax=Peribacillus cavernae TaxID=1674310 RepID=A0A433HGH8_9BACI|nr:DNA integrity scanning diadenylate cyclase DisA [Peribacillus cavernae]MDQ0220527.1 diadenylate cyclase [Peribacillus cavernae]RUQ27409.1 DNA integrity scanning protein DisA [Peribacillus cavernae]